MLIEIGFFILFCISIGLVYLINYSSEFRMASHHIILWGIFGINIILMIFVITFFYYKRDYQGASGPKGFEGEIGPEGETTYYCKK